MPRDALLARCEPRRVLRRPSQKRGRLRPDARSCLDAAALVLADSSPSALPVVITTRNDARALCPRGAGYSWTIDSAGRGVVIGSA